MSVIRHGMTFASEKKATQHFSKNPIKATPILIFKSRQAGNKWLPDNRDLIPAYVGSVYILKTIDGHVVSLTNEGFRSYLAEGETGRYYWAGKEVVKLVKPVKEIYDAKTSLFNSTSKIDKRVKKAFLEFFDQDLWDKEIQPFLDKGVMSILDTEPNDYTKFYVWSVWLFTYDF